jgi:hypothetical protein
VDLFGMYGSRSDGEPDDAAEAQQQPPAEEERLDHDDVLEPEEITQPIQIVTEVEKEDSLIVPTQLTPSTAESVAAYVAEIGTVIDESMLLRPYVRTGGRTHADADLAMEALVIGVPIDTERTRLSPEHKQVHTLSAEPRSVAEIAAYTRLPIGSARVIIADMLHLGLLVQCSNDAPTDSPSMDLMERVRNGLRHL